MIHDSEILDLGLVNLRSMQNFQLKYEHFYTSECQNPNLQNHIHSRMPVQGHEVKIFSGSIFMANFPTAYRSYWY